VYRTYRIRRRRTILVFAVVLAFVLAPVSRAGNGVPAGMTGAAWQALQLRSEALNQQYAPERALAIRSEALERAYGLESSPSGGTATQAVTALKARSEGLNRAYGIGSSSSGGTAAQALHALEVRGDALNQRYQLGRYAVISVSNGFDWTDAGIGAAAMLGFVLALGGVAVVARRSRRPGDASAPSMT